MARSTDVCNSFSPVSKPPLLADPFLPPLLPAEPALASRYFPSSSDRTCLARLRGKFVLRLTFSRRDTPCCWCWEFCWGDTELWIVSKRCEHSRLSPVTPGRVGAIPSGRTCKLLNLNVVTFCVARQWKRFCDRLSFCHPYNSIHPPGDLVVVNSADFYE